MKKIIWGMVLAICLTGCGGGGGGDEGSNNETLDSFNNTEAISSIEDEQGVSVISGFDFKVHEGDYWLYDWEYNKSRTSSFSSEGYTTTPSTTNTTKSGTIRITLGQERTILGIRFNELIVEYEGEASQSSYKPVWKHISVFNNKIYGLKENEGDSTNGVYIIFDAYDGEWNGGLFWGGTFNGSTVLDEPAPTLSASLNDEALYEVQYPYSSLAIGMGINYDKVEYYLPEIGFAGLSSWTRSTLSLSGANSTTTEEEDIYLTSSSLGI